MNHKSVELHKSDSVSPDYNIIAVYLLGEKREYNQYRIAGIFSSKIKAEDAKKEYIKECNTKGYKHYNLDIYTCVLDHRIKELD